MKRDPDYRRHIADHIPADRTPYHGEPESDMLDLGALEEQRAGEELAMPDEEDFAPDDRLTLCFTCSVCRIVPVDPLRGQVTCSWCLSRS